MAFAVLLSGCGANDGDPSVCTPVLEPRRSSSVEDSLAKQQNPDWQLVRAEACVHRQAYRLAKSPDPAPIVAKAVVVYCEAPIDGVARVSAHSEIDAAADDLVTSEELSALADRIAEIKTNFESYALSKVVEGRAGKCRA
ncbi:MAG: hypothetical protein EOO23_05705 [Comamonadaceae bacterium]|nr:MAG: hypothetical protein EOO23_05705 [Comamonadaceae bacterium]